MSTLLDRNGRPRNELLLLAGRHHIDVRDDITAQELLEQLLEKWLRTTAHQYQILGDPPAEEDVQLLTKLGFIEAVPAQIAPYVGALILGATVVAVRKRLAYLRDQYMRGSHVHNIYLLGSTRKLDPQRESIEVLRTPAELKFRPEWQPSSLSPQTEAEMMELVFVQSELPRPWHQTLITASSQKAADGTERPANTLDTVKEFVKISPPAGAYLAVSSQPFVQRQDRQVRSCVPPELRIFTIGYAASPTLPLKTFLDEAARLLNEEIIAQQTS